MKKVIFIKKIFITGFNGFVGSWLVSLLFKLGAINYGYALNNNKKMRKFLI